MSTFTPSIPADEAAGRLRSLFSFYGTVHVLTRHTSRSGMLRRMSLFVIRDGDLVDITVPAAAVLRHDVRSEDHTIAVSGTGVDMQYHVVYQLSRALYADVDLTDGDDPGYALKKRTI